MIAIFFFRKRRKSEQVLRESRSKRCFDTDVRRSSLFLRKKVLAYLRFIFLEGSEANQNRSKVPIVGRTIRVSPKKIVYDLRVSKSLEELRSDLKKLFIRDFCTFSGFDSCNNWKKRFCNNREAL